MVGPIFPLRVLHVSSLKREVSVEVQDRFHQMEQEPGASSALCILRTEHQGTGTRFSAVQKVFFLQQKSTRIWNRTGHT